MSLLNLTQTAEVTLGAAPMTIQDLVAIAHGAKVLLDPAALDGMRPVQAMIVGAIAEGRPIYGLTTGIGDLYSVRLTAEQIEATQIDMLRSHASGVGAPLDTVSVRAIMAAMIRAMLHGASGVSPDLVLTMAEMLNRGVTPWAPVKGSVGYLIATAHIGLSVFGEGQSWFDGALLPADEALSRAGIALRRPLPREGHALISGTYEISGLGTLALHEVERLVALADLSGAMSIEAMRGNTRGFDPRLQAMRPHPGQAETARRLNLLLAESEILAANHDHRLQDALSLRCMPQVHGAARDAIAFARTALETELNALTDNPVFLIEDGALQALPGGNGHGAPVALALDFLAIAVASLSTMSQARSDRLVSAHLSGLPAFLMPAGGSGFSISPCIAAALSAENRALAAPATVHTMSTVAGQEDHLSMGVHAAQKALAAAENLAGLVALELLLAAQAQDMHLPLTGGRASRAAYDLIRESVAFRDSDRAMYPDLALVRTLVDSGRFDEIVADAVAPAAN